ncbi:MAG TPA: isoprenyl transferase [Candidatus Fraserbacteria bacterium]|nr:isoprenyl transferase [Candidatus Fraserbacteria bacterium]
MSRAPRLAELKDDQLPRHLAIIMDGNGRWALHRGQRRTSGHQRGAEATEAIVEFVARELPIKYLTLFAFSAENWGRPPEEIDFLMQLLGDFLRRKLDRLLEQGVCLRLLGEIEQLPLSVQGELRRALELSQGQEGLQLNLALNYGGRQEILRAVRALLADQAQGHLERCELDEACFSRYLYTTGLPDPDLLIRTGGEQRLSNFLLWQIAYTELWITPTLWPDFTPEELLEALAAYRARERRYGTVKLARSR